MTVYIASAEKYVGQIQEDIYIRDSYTSKGISSEIATLSDIVKKSKPNDIVMLKSIWGYHINYATFIEQIQALKNKDIILINDYKYIEWNLNKGKYIADLSSLKVIPTRILNIKNAESLLDVSDIINQSINELTDDRFVVKPAISASGYLTFLYELNTNVDLIISELYNNKDLEFIIQPYRPLISEGEISIILINGEILYAVNRYPGVLVEKKEITYISLTDIPFFIMEQVILMKKFLINKFGSLPRICRVDFLKNSTDYEILEIELIDPDLFLKNIPENVREGAIALLFTL